MTSGISAAGPDVEIITFLLGAALEGTHFVWAKIDIPPILTYFLSLLQLAKQLYPFKLYRNSVQGGMADAKSYLTNAKTHHDEASQVTDLSPGSSRSDKVRHGNIRA